jgi:hypothetical protein
MEYAMNQAQHAARDLAQRRLCAAVDHFQGAGVTLTAGAVPATAVCIGPNGEGLRCRFERDGILRVSSKKTGALLAVSAPGNPAVLSADFDPLPADRLRPVID